jgi:hypothetical protein
VPPLAPVAKSKTRSEPPWKVSYRTQTVMLRLSPASVMFPNEK